MRVLSLIGKDRERAIPALARLRIEIFREFPYLYDGSLAYEADYLEAFIESKDGIIVTAEDGDRIVGCATGAALADHHDAFVAPFRARNFDPASIFYCSESLLLPAYRRQGLGHMFFDRREDHAKTRGYRLSAFCAVQRAADHPLRPVNYFSLEPFWVRRGYRRVEGVTAMFRWKDIDQAEESGHVMALWMREL